MTEELDSGIALLLRAGAPAERDPLFRIRVLERRERERHRRRSRALLAGATLVVLIHVVALVLAPDVFTAAIGAVFCLAVVAAGALSVRAALPVIRNLRG